VLTTAIRQKIAHAVRFPAACVWGSSRAAEAWRLDAFPQRHISGNATFPQDRERMSSAAGAGAKIHVARRLASRALDLQPREAAIDGLVNRRQSSSLFSIVANSDQ
jgi:hypothetical protein